MLGQRVTYIVNVQDQYTAILNVRFQTACQHVSVTAINLLLQKLHCYTRTQ